MIAVLVVPSQQVDSLTLPGHPLARSGPTPRGRCDRGAQRLAESPFGRLAAAEMTCPLPLTSVAGTDPGPSRRHPRGALSFPAPPIASGRGGRPRVAQSWNQSAGYRSGSPRGSHLRSSSVPWAVTRPAAECRPSPPARPRRAGVLTRRSRCRYNPPGPAGSVPAPIRRPARERPTFFARRAP